MLKYFEVIIEQDSIIMDCYSFSKTIEQINKYAKEKNLEIVSIAPQNMRGTTKGLYVGFKEKSNE